MKQWPIPDESTVVKAQVAALEKRLDALERILSQMVQAYTEVGSLLNVLTDEVLKEYDQEELDEFYRRAGKGKVAMLRVMQEAAREVERMHQQDGQPSTGVVEGFKPHNQ